MLRSTLVGTCRLLLGVFFRKIEVVGEHHLPQDGALLFALNHPSGLIDPLFVLCLSGKRVSFLAKAPLFHMPFVGIFVRAFESLPVYRSQDGADPAKNRAMMTAASELLARGNALALFPEGTSHDDADLKRFRSGAARIALSARAYGKQPVRIVPAALYYEGKETFRSRAVLSFGPPLEVPHVELDEKGSTPIQIGQELTAELSVAIRRIMPTADSADSLILAEQAERLFNAALRDTPQLCPCATTLVSRDQSGTANPKPPEQITLGQRMRTRRRMIDAYLEHSGEFPKQVDSLISRVMALRDQLDLHGLPIDAPAQSGPDWWRRRIPRLAALVALAPASLLGVVMNYPTYVLIRWIAFRYSGDQMDVMATVKLLAGLLLFPLTWLLWPGAAALYFSNPTLWLGAAAGPFLAWAAVAAGDNLGELRHSLAVSSRAKKAALDWNSVLDERARICEEMAVLLPAKAN